MQGVRASTTTRRVCREVSSPRGATEGLAVLILGESAHYTEALALGGRAKHPESLTLPGSARFTVATNLGGCPG